TITFIVYGKVVSDSQSGFKAITSDALSRMKLNSAGYEICSEFIGEVHRNRLSYKSLPVKALYTQYSQRKGQPFLNGINLILGMLTRLLGAPDHATHFRKVFFLRARRYRNCQELRRFPGAERVAAHVHAVESYLGGGCICFPVSFNRRRHPRLFGIRPCRARHVLRHGMGFRSLRRLQNLCQIRTRRAETNEDDSGIGTQRRLDRKKIALVYFFFFKSNCV